MAIRGKQLAQDTITDREIDASNPLTTAVLDTTNGTISTVNAGDAAVEGSGAGVARRDHQHAVATAAAGAIAVGDLAAEGVSSGLARADHTHALPAPAAPANVDAAAAAAGVATTVARADHKHAASVGTPVTIDDTANAEGVATSLARSDHQHAHGTRGGGTLHAAATPSLAGFMSAADKTKLDNLSTVEGFNVKASARIATTVNDSLSGLAARDGVTPIAGDRVLVKAQSSPVQNGIYVAAAGAWSRSADLPTGVSARSTFVFIDEGAANADTSWFCTTDPPTDVVGTDPLTFVHFLSAGQLSAGAGLVKTGQAFDVVSANAAITVNPDSIEFNGLQSDAQHGNRGGGLLHALVVAAGASGFMSGSDKSKLDGIAAGAQVNFTSRQERVTTQTITIGDVALTDTLNFTPVSNASVLLFLNGVQLIQGAGEDYSISGTTITWLRGTGTAPVLATNDDLVAYYLS